MLRLIAGVVFGGLAIFYFDGILFVTSSLLMSFDMFLNVITSRCKVNEVIGLDISGSMESQE
ncbi:hypothetical protein AKJ47_01920 [candidate division MSBL1 archaeon SCGC-AAA261G05]|uniref:DUF2892 domain-containing protein n=2 Tax=candidate division MSBL1 TaxID=215777 RepID=A0A133VAY2_9EURY|nr:hypothetical protein AKJ47_01920 [candidate division MSBL1 archaeon SCGC-AAA261G05]KXB04554.1 hypothetical protein AKJ48_02165 [candidate division MSBL1 archaeon SCGC-AAA261O19]